MIPGYIHQIQGIDPTKIFDQREFPTLDLTGRPRNIKIVVGRHDMTGQDSKPYPNLTESKLNHEVMLGNVPPLVDCCNRNTFIFFKQNILSKYQ